MAVKDEILRLFEENRGKVLSGQELANRLSVSRAAVWKAMNVLKKEGYAIRANTNKGYWLEGGGDFLSADGVRALLCPRYRDCDIHVLASSDSTNNVLKRLAMEGAPHGTIILSNEQTAGRGRMGRTFYSPPRGGVYMSILLRPRGPVSDALPVTAAAAVAVCGAVEALTGERPAIKWVNDILIGGKKICGILTEAVSDFESGMAEFVIVGIGINVTIREDDFPLDLQGKAGSLVKNGISRNRLAAEIAGRLLDLQENLTAPSLIGAYRAYSMMPGKRIRFILDNEAQRGTVQSINDRGHLVVIGEDGSAYTLRSGEVHIVGIE